MIQYQFNAYTVNYWTIYIILAIFYVQQSFCWANQDTLGILLYKA